MRAFVIGNLAVDETIAVEEMPTAGTSILGRERSRDLGGKGCNQALVMARAGLPTALLAAVGEDPRAEFARAELEGEPLSATLAPRPGLSTDFSIIFTTPDGENAIVTTSDCAVSLTPGDAEPLLAEAVAGDLLVLQGNLDDATTRSLLTTARMRGLVSAFNPSPFRPDFASLVPLADAVFVNEGEARALTARAGRAALDALRAMGPSTVVLTLGARGALLSNASGIVEVPAERCPVVDTTGAGDAFMGTALASAARRGVPLDARAIGEATRASALTVGRVGTRAAFPSVRELAAILSI